MAWTALSLKLGGTFQVSRPWSLVALLVEEIDRSLGIVPLAEVVRFPLDLLRPASRRVREEGKALIRFFRLRNGGFPAASLHGRLAHGIAFHSCTKEMSDNRWLHSAGCHVLRPISLSGVDSQMYGIVESREMSVK